MRFKIELHVSVQFLSLYYIILFLLFLMQHKPEIGVSPALLLINDPTGQTGVGGSRAGNDIMVCVRIQG